MIREAYIGFKKGPDPFYGWGFSLPTTTMILEFSRHAWGAVPGVMATRRRSTALHGADREGLYYQAPVESRDSRANVKREAKQLCQKARLQRTHWLRSLPRAERHQVFRLYRSTYGVPRMDRRRRLAVEEAARLRAINNAIARGNA